MVLNLCELFEFLDKSLFRHTLNLRKIEYARVNKMYG